MSIFVNGVNVDDLVKGAGKAKEKTVIKNRSEVLTGVKGLQIIDLTANIKIVPVDGKDILVSISGPGDLVDGVVAFSQNGQGVIKGDMKTSSSSRVKQVISFGGNNQINIVSGGSNVHVVQTNNKDGDTFICSSTGFEPMEIEIKVGDAIEDLEIRGINGIVTVGEFDNTRLDVTVAGTNSVTVDAAEHLYGVVSGSGSLSVSKVGPKARVKLKVSGSGDVMIMSGDAVNLDASVSGSGLIDIRNVAVYDADLAVSGSGGIDVGKPIQGKLCKHVSGSGRINAQDTGNGDHGRKFW
ncbi:MAG: DUF2807 domain-containing protein [Candidatus Saccharibacteria bacterium]|nr:DUF2807 domain-containing protein [Candidatus Saccharibacteria bacterium]